MRDIFGEKPVAPLALAISKPLFIETMFAKPIDLTCKPARSELCPSSTALAQRQPRMCVSITGRASSSSPGVWVDVKLYD